MTISNPTTSVLALAATLTAGSPLVASAQDIVVDAGRLFDGREVIDDARLVIADGRISAIGPRSEIEAPEGVEIVDHGERFVMPGLIAAHSHVGTVSGTEHGGEFYSRETVARDLAQFQRYGIVAVNALGLNRPLFHELREEFRGNEHGGADLYGAGPGVGASDGAPPQDDMGVEDDQVFRAGSPEEAREAVRRMAEDGVDMIKVWVDDLDGEVPKMEPEIYRAAIEEAHALGLPAAAHIHDLGDAKGVVEAGVGVVGHGVRDAEVDAEFIELMLESGAWYVPTIQIDEADYIYAEHPEWLEDAFLAQGVNVELAAQIEDEAWREEALSEAADAREAVAINIANLGLLHEAGVNIAMGTDSGATALRIPGFAEHRELELMVEAGLSPTEALTAATAGGAEMMRLEDRGLLAEGYRADFLVLDEDPTADILATRSIHEIRRNGALVE